MKVKSLMFLLFLASCPFFVRGNDIDDVELQEILKTAFLDVHSVQGQLLDTLARINFASNRFVSAAKQIYADPESCAGQKRRALSLVAKFGSSEDVGFVMSCATNSEYWVTATLGVTNLLGVHSNSVALVSELLQTHYDLDAELQQRLETSQGYVVDRLLRRAEGIDAATRGMLLSLGLAFASNRVSQAVSTDAALMRFDPTYANSRRRLEILRHQLNHLGCGSQTNYISNAISELEAYPEENLPE